MNLPNALTLLRIFLVPLLLAVLLTRTESGVWVGTGIFGVAVATDYLDGYFARRRNQVTRLGILLDPVADKLLTAAAFIALVELDAVPAWMVFIIVGRELVVTGFRSIAAGRNIVIPASVLGKSKMALQVVAIFLLLLGRGQPMLRGPALVALWLVVVVSVVSAADYFQRCWREVVKGPARGDAGTRPAKVA